MLDYSQAPAMGRFNGEYHPVDWVLQMERYFYVYSISDALKLPLAAICLDDDARDWFRWLYHTNQFRDWDDFVDQLFIQFRSRTRAPFAVNRQPPVAQNTQPLSSISSSPLSQFREELVGGTNKTDAHKLFVEISDRETDVEIEDTVTSAHKTCVTDGGSSATNVVSALDDAYSNSVDIPEVHTTMSDNSIHATFPLAAIDSNLGNEHSCHEDQMFAKSSHLNEFQLLKPIIYKELSLLSSYSQDSVAANVHGEYVLRIGGGSFVAPNYSARRLDITFAHQLFEELSASEHFDEIRAPYLNIVWRQHGLDLHSWVDTGQKEIVHLPCDCAGHIDTRGMTPTISVLAQIGIAKRLDLDHVYEIVMPLSVTTLRYSILALFMKDCLHEVLSAAEDINRTTQKRGCPAMVLVDSNEKCHFDTTFDQHFHVQFSFDPRVCLFLVNSRGPLLIPGAGYIEVNFQILTLQSHTKYAASKSMTMTKVWDPGLQWMVGGSIFLDGLLLLNESIHFLLLFGGLRWSITLAVQLLLQCEVGRNAHILETYLLEAAMSRNNIAVSIYVLLSVAISQVDNNRKDFLRATSYMEPWCLNVVERALSLFGSTGIKSKQTAVTVNWEESSNADRITIVIRYLMWFPYTDEAFMRAGLIINRAVVSYKSFFYVELQDYRWLPLEVELQMSCRKRVAWLMFLQEFKIKALALALPCFDFEDGNTSHRDQIVGDELVNTQLILIRSWPGIVLPLYDLMEIEKLDEGECALKAMPSDGLLLGANGGSRTVIVTLVYYFQKVESKLVFDPGGSTFVVLIFKDIEGVFEAFVKAVATLSPYNFGYASSEVTNMSESTHINLLARVCPQFHISMFNSCNDLWNQQTMQLQNLEDKVLNSGGSIVMSKDNSYIAYGSGPVIWTEVGQTIRHKYAKQPYSPSRG